MKFFKVNFFVQSEGSPSRKRVRIIPLPKKKNYFCLSNPMLATFLKNVCIYTYVFSIPFHGKSAIVQDTFLIKLEDLPGS